MDQAAVSAGITAHVAAGQIFDQLARGGQTVKML
jgi:hypothetical protein